MNCSERADNMSKRKLIEYFKPDINKNVKLMLTVPVHNEPIIEAATSQDKEAVTIEEYKPFYL